MTKQTLSLESFSSEKESFNHRTGRKAEPDSGRKAEPDSASQRLNILKMFEMPKIQAEKSLRVPRRNNREMNNLIRTQREREERGRNREHEFLSHIER